LYVGFSLSFTTCLGLHGQTDRTDKQPNKEQAEKRISKKRPKNNEGKQHSNKTNEKRAECDHLKKGSEAKFLSI
jgi:hypothetical protein